MIFSLSVETHKKTFLLLVFLIILSFLSIYITLYYILLSICFYPFILKMRKNGFFKPFFSACLFNYSSFSAIVLFKIRLCNVLKFDFFGYFSNLVQIGEIHWFFKYSRDNFQKQLKLDFLYLVFLWYTMSIRVGGIVSSQH